MNEIEQRLKAARLPEPSVDLDRRLEDAFETARERARGSRHASWWWGVGAVAAAGLVVVAGLMSRRVPPSPPPGRAIVYQVEAQGRLRDLLVTPAGTRGGPPPLVIRVH